MSFSRNVKDAAKALLGKPVKNEAYERAERERTLSLVRWFDAPAAALERSEALLRQGEGERPPQSVLWLLVNFAHPYGGVFTVLRIADALERNGIRNRIVVYDNPSFDISPQLPTINRYFPALGRECFVALNGKLDDLPPADLGIATFWPSAYLLVNCDIVRKKAYLIQDFEAAFYPAGTTYALAENTYRLPLHRVCNTPGLMRFIESNYPLPEAKSVSFTPAADERYRCAVRPLSEPMRVLFYARPNTPRNAYELAVAFARKLKETYGNRVRLVAAGERDAGGVGVEVFEHVGIVPYDELPAFYASFHFVVSFMLTKHPSYLPFEAMAAGCAVLSNANEANGWLLHDGENCFLAQPTVSSLMEAFARAMDHEVYERVAHAGQETVGQLNWGEEMKRILTFFDYL